MIDELIPEIKSLKADIAGKGGYPFYLIAGDEGRLADEAVRVIREYHSQTEHGNLSLVNVDLSDKSVSIDSVLSAVHSIPLFGGRQFVLARSFLASKHGGALTRYLQDPSPHSVLVLLASEHREKSQFFSDFQQKGKIVLFKPLSKRDIRSFLSFIAVQNKLRFEKDAFELMIDLTGEDREGCISAIEKLACYRGQDSVILMKDVEDLVPRTKSHKIFELTDSIADNIPGRALKILHRMLFDGEDPLGILSSIIWHFRTMLKVKDMISKGRSQEDVIQKLNSKPFLVEKYISQSSKFSPDSLISSLDLFLRADRDLKMKKMKSEIIFEDIIFRLSDLSGKN
jgi:DNA polymerase-3 subunit delta